MRVRHKTPTIFNLSMVDVLCCALGCVILLWLLNLRDAREQALLAGTTNDQLETTRSELAALKTRATELQAQLDEARKLADATGKRLAAAEEQARTTAASLRMIQGEREQARSRIAELDKQLAELRAEKTAADERLVKKAKDLADVEKKMTTTGRRVTDLEARLREQEALADLVPGLRDEVKSYRYKLATAEALAQGRGKEMSKQSEELVASRKTVEELRASKRLLEDDLDARRKEAADARRTAEALQGENKSLVLDVSRARAAAENRFAGIELTGKRVVFLIDMSGSMALIDETTPSPPKWPGVRETVAKIMRSLPQLEKFQVVVFSERASFLLGGDGRWLDYDAKASPDTLLNALANIQPKGGTNMYAALETAFRYRPLGLDTIYLMSDGLPNIGEGLAPEQARSLKDTEQADVLGKHIRKKLKNEWNAAAGQPRVRINAVGFFYESPDVGAFLWALARENDGSFVGMSRP